MDISKWAFKNRNLVYFLVTVLFVGGILSCYQMSKLEDPEIKVKLAMVVTTYPGASAHQVELEVTDVLEKSIRSMGNIDNVESYSYNDLSLIQIELTTNGTVERDAYSLGSHCKDRAGIRTSHQSQRDEESGRQIQCRAHGTDEERGKRP